jgi:uncharacterized protein (TIGR02099 family)
VTLSPVYRWIGRPTLALYRLLTWVTLCVALMLVVTALVLRYVVFPNLQNYREDIQLALTTAVGQPVTVGKASGNWDGLRPELILEDVALLDHAGRPALNLARIDLTLAWLSLAVWEPRFHSIELHRPALRVGRDKRGVISVAGLEVGEQEGGTEFSDWLLRQAELVVRGASLTWHDELRAATPLVLRDVDLFVSNDGDRHRFGLRAVPPRELAGPLDLRGDVSGASVATLPQWTGRLFAQLDTADLAAWRTWVPFPIEMRRGTGAVRMWLTVGLEQRVTDLVADVKLANVNTRLAPELDELDLTELSGRIAWKASARVLEVSTAKLGLTTQRGLTLPPADFFLRMESGKDGNPARGELRANAVDLEPLAVLADRLPLGDEARKRLLAAEPRGSLFDVIAQWGGDWRSPTHFTVRGRFQGLALARTQHLPGFSGVSGSIEGNEKSGSLHFSNVNATLDMPGLFAGPLAFDTLAGQLQWSRGARSTEIRLTNVAFSNRDMTGSVAGVYTRDEAGPGSIDVAGHLTRANARDAVRYIPITIAKGSRPWLSNAFIAGQSNDVRFHAKGDLARFPFPDDKGGTFFVVAKVTGGTLHYADGWPRIENIEGDLAFRGKRMEINARQGSIYGVTLPRVRVEIPDLEAAEEVLSVDGEAEGPTADFLQFIANSPVADMIDRFSDGMQAEGRGKLALKLTLPLRKMADSKVSGVFQFGGNRLVADRDLPPLEQLTGRLEFTESEVRVPGATGAFLGGPLTISAGSQTDGAVRITAQGRASADNVRRAGGPPWMRYLRGSTDWRGTMTLRKKLADLVVESNLQGVASALPAPFIKSASESIPMRIERQYVGPQQERLALAYGSAVSAVLVRRTDGKASSIERGAIRFGEGAAPEPESPGLWVTGALKALDADDWLKLMGEIGGTSSYTLSGVDVKVQALDVFDRQFHDLAVKATGQSGGLQIALAGRELEGSATWQSQGKGRVSARFSRLILPEVQEKTVVPEAEKASAADRVSDLPALDVTADQFQLGNKQLGKLELTASPEERDWRIERLRITNPDGTLTVDGVWQSWLARPRTRVNLRFDVADVGRMLTRFGYPKGVRGGTAKIEGNLAWNGSPQKIDYPTLSGSLHLDSAKGQFLKLDPGIGKLLGILSLQALPRRITLDFRDIFSAGFAYDQIVGTVKVSHGIASTTRLGIDGPAARVSMAGEVDLARETQKLTVTVVPGILEGVAIAAGLAAGPLGGAVGLGISKLFREPLEQFISYEYLVTGTWGEPVVTKAQRLGAIEAGRPE